MSKNKIVLFLIIFSTIFSAATLLCRPAAKTLYIDLETATILLEKLPDGRLALKTETHERGSSAPATILVNRPIDYFNAIHNPEGGIILAWSESSGSDSQVFTARIQDRRLLNPRLVYSGDFIHSLVLATNETGVAWLALIEEAPKTRIVIQQLFPAGRGWIVESGKDTRSLVLCATDNDHPWLFWMGGDRTNDIRFSRFNGEYWQEPGLVIGDQGRPRLYLSADLDYFGYPRLAWSQSGKRSYSLMTTAWQGNAWSSIEEIHPGNGAALEPHLFFLEGSVPWVFWKQIRNGNSVISFSHLAENRWSPEQTALQADSVKSWQASYRQGFLQFSWQDDCGWQQEKISVAELRSSSRAFPEKRAFEPSLVRDENRYLAFGDSITFGYMDYKEAPASGYVPRLETLLKNAFGLARVSNGGAPGEITADGLARIEALLAMYPFYFALLMEGTNDMIFPEITMESAADNLVEMAEICREQEITPLLATIIPRNDWWWHNKFFRERLFELNELIRASATAQGINLVDQFNAFYDYPESEGGWTSLLSSDQSHPNEEGYQLMAETWFQALRPLKIKVYPPVAFSGFQVRTLKIDPNFLNLFNVLSWQENPQNDEDGVTVTEYKLFRKEKNQPDSAYILLEVISAGIYSYTDRQITPGKTYVYSICALDADEHESEQVSIEVMPR